MATSDVDVVNAALIELGQPPITTLFPPDRSKQAEYAASIYKTTLDRVLRAVPWESATTRAALSLDGTTPDFGYGNAFNLPPDYIALVLFNGVLGWDQQTVPWKIERQRILTNDSDGNLVYVFRLEDPAAMDASLKEALIARLTADLALPLTGDNAKKRLMEELYRDRVATAELEALKQRSMEAQQPGSWIAAHQALAEQMPRRIDVDAI